MSQDSIKRRDILKTIAATSAIAAAPAAGFAAPAINKGIRQWKMVMTWPKVLPGLGTGAERLAKRITALSDGKLEIKVYGGGELVPPQEVFDAVSRGTAEMGHSAAYYWLSKNRSSAFFCDVPGGMTAQEKNGWLYFGGGQQLWDELYAEFNLKPFPAGNTGTQMGGWFNKELQTLDDIKGLKMRIPGLAGEVFSKLGGSSQTIPAQELFTSMQSGVIDALEWVGPWNDMSLGFHRVSKYYYGPAFQEGGPTLELMVNRGKYESLPKDLQLIVKCACATENDVMLAEFQANNIRSFHELKNKESVDIRVYPEEILKAFFSTAEHVVADTAKEGLINRKIYESYSKFRRFAMDMADVSELGFMKARLLAKN